MRKNKTLLVCYLFLSWQILNSQAYIPLPDSNTVWSVNTDNYLVKGDSIYNQQVYKKYYVTNDVNLSPTKLYYAGMLRQDNAAKKVYGIKTGQTFEKLLYNFNANVNDTLTVTPMRFIYANNDSKVKVIFKDSVSIGNQYRKRLKLRGYPSQGAYDEYWIEGVGSTSGPLDPGLSTVFITDICYPELLCQKQENLLKYTHPFYNSCYLNLCSVGLHESKPDRIIKVYPNPVIDKTVIEQNTNAGELDLSVVNLLGAELKRTRFNNKTELDLGDLNAGIYFVKVRKEGQLIGTRKIVKE